MKHKMCLRYLILIINILLSDHTISGCTKTLTIFANYEKDNLSFFKEIYPWVIDNIGQYINVRYRFLDNIRRSGPRSCVMEQLRRNPYLQSDYLKCEADGKPTDDCVRYSKINTHKFNQCIISKAKAFKKRAERDYHKLKSPETPFAIYFSRKIISIDNDQNEVLKQFCSIFGRRKPNGCLNSSPPSNSTSTTLEIITDNTTPRDITNIPGSTSIPQATTTESSDNQTLTSNSSISIDITTPMISTILDTTTIYENSTILHTIKPDTNLNETTPEVITNIEDTSISQLTTTQSPDDQAIISNSSIAVNIATSTIITTISDATTIFKDPTISTTFTESDAISNEATSENGI